MQNNEHTTLSVPKGKRKENEGVPRGSRGRGDNQGNCHFHFSDCFFLIPYFAKKIEWICCRSIGDARGSIAALWSLNK